MTEENNDNPDPENELAANEEESSAPVAEEVTPLKYGWRSLARNYVSFVGFAIAIAALVCIALLFLLELTGSTDQPYLGLLIWILFPAVMLVGILVVGLGMLVERRRRRKFAAEEIAEYPVLDLNDPKRRRSLIVFLVFSIVFLFVSAFGAYHAYEFTESVTFCGQLCHEVMQPEFVSYGVAPHAEIKCVECHVGSGAEWYARSKLNGVRQLIKVSFNTYDRPIKTPIHNMRPPNDTCAKCHWADKYHGEKLKVFTDYGYDEQSTMSETRLLIKVGGGSPETGRPSGIHWHMNLANEVTYVSTDEKRQDIRWVQFRDINGNLTQYFREGSTFTEQQIAEADKKQMDCIDCHSRPAHIYLSPNNAVDNSITAGKLDRSLPFLKKTAVEVLSKDYQTTEQALATISDDFHRYYRENHPDVYATDQPQINLAVAEIKRIYRTYFFPEMKTDWRSHIDNIGHFNAQGCFRCHDGRMKSPEGKVIRNDCAICHVTLSQSFRGTSIEPDNGRFRHPLDLGTAGNYNCASCHKGDRSFSHPVNLGDISRFSCNECHKEEGF
ncbi:MAG: cytochrome C [Acidobacteria bacterium]|nr:MAG: cytochrome C [Acidobacteriota bacterium]REJ99032.1 MAG: cytochrome C [Acidobacteriota bacterium]REK16247.1 MAG: cytochrome C [Acidobacteriota bacterium]REK43928.1 MAG: cytochrome C [Acidobacteriota bacterium]